METPRLTHVTDGRSPPSFDQFFQAEYPGLVRACFLLTADRAEAEEIAQEAMASIANSSSTDPRRTPSASFPSRSGTSTTWPRFEDGAASRCPAPHPGGGGPVQSSDADPPITGLPEIAEEVTQSLSAMRVGQLPRTQESRWRRAMSAAASEVFDRSEGDSGEGR